VSACLSYVEAQTKVTAIKYMTGRTGGGDAADCGPTNVVCDGGFERVMGPSNGATNVIPQVASVILEYSGTLDSDKFISLVDQTINNGNPCVGGYAAATADSLHSGAMTAISGTKQVLVPQAGVNLLDATKTFSVCYAETDGTGSDATWAYSGILLRISKIEQLTVYGRNFKTSGTIPSSAGVANTGALKMHYEGTVLEERWVSLVAATLNANEPCASGSVAAAPADESHSGSRAAVAGTKTFSLNTASLSKSLAFAVCYTESGGITSSLWRDTGIRVKISKIHSVNYGVDTSRFGDGFARTTTNRNEADMNPVATDKLPVRPGAKIQYVGELPASKYISLVDDSLMSDNPCAYAQMAAAAANTAGSANLRVHSGAILADSTKTVTIPQLSGSYLDYDKRYAVCYSEGAGDTSDLTWADSYIRFELTRIESVTHHSAIHGTTGSLPNTPTALTLAYEAANFPAGDGSGVKFTIVDASSGQQTHTYNQQASGSTAVTYTVTTSFPCDGDASRQSRAGLRGNGDGTTNLAALTNAGSTSTGAIVANAGVKTVSVTTDTLDTGTLNSNQPPQLTETVFAVCYTENANTAGLWRDSGIRLTISKMESITYGTVVPTGPATDTPRTMLPVTSTMLTTGLAAAGNVIAQASMQTISYTSDVVGTDLAIEKYVSLVDASVNANKPCVLGTQAAHAQDNQHTGTVLATTGTRNVAIPQGVLLDDTATFAVCYALSEGTSSDPTWADSYIRVTVSKIQTLVSIGVTHKVTTYTGHIAYRDATNKLDLTYGGTLAANMWISLVDQTLGTNPNFPCATHADTTPSTSTTGKVQASIGTKTALTTTSSLSKTITFAVCYSSESVPATWYESGIRVKISAISSMQTSSGYSYYLREQTSVFLPTNRFSQVASQKLTYVDNGDIGTDKHISLVDITLNSGTPCVDAAVAASAQNTLGSSGARRSSGPVQGRTAGGGAGGKIATLTQATSDLFLDASKIFTLCYSTDGGTTGDTWQDSYIHFGITQLHSLQQSIGKWTSGVCLNGQAGCTSNGEIEGQVLEHVTVGHLPQMTSGDTGLDITYTGSLVGSSHISLVDSTLSPTTTHGIVYHAPCGSSVRAAAAADTVHSGALTGAANKVINTLTTTGLDTTVTYAVCYATGDGSTLDSTWKDSGVRLTISKLQKLLTSSRHVGISTREQTAVYRQTNRLPQTASNELTYVGTLAASKYISIVDASLDSGNPCVTRDGNGDTTTAILSASTTASGAITADASKKFVVPQNGGVSQLLDKAKVFAVCYSETGASTGDQWMDSYIRFGITMIESFTTGGITFATVGHFANTLGQAYKFTYNGNLLAGKRISLVDSSVNQQVPCGSARAANDPGVGPERSQYTGVKVAAASVKDVTNLDTTYLDTSLSFALCYTDASGSASDTNWQDSGLRFTVTKIHNLMFASGHTGPADKADTKPRDQTSYPHAMNMMPAQVNQQLEYVGTLASAKWVSLVDASLNPSTENAMFGTPGLGLAGPNPCANPAVAAASADADHTGAVAATGNIVTFPQSTLLDHTKTFAACYAEVDGTDSDTTWRDTYIRFKITRLTSLSVITPVITVGTTTQQTENIVVKHQTVGQIPVQDFNTDSDAQVRYEYEGALENNMFISLILADQNQVADTNTALSVFKPCEDKTDAGQQAPDNTHSGPHQAESNNKIIKTLETGDQINKLNTGVTYALCYSYGANAGLAVGDWYDSGIRLTVAKLGNLNYAGTPATIKKRTRTMTTIHEATHVIPQVPSVALTYGCDNSNQGCAYPYMANALTDNKYLSLVDASLNGANPCVNPSVAAAVQSTQHSGSISASARDISILQNTHLLDASKIFTVCYAETDGTASDNTWRDSYIHLRISKVAHITSYGVQHKTTGQISNHASLKIDYFGSLAEASQLSLVDATAASTTLGVQQYPMPCASMAQTTATADTLHSGPATASSYYTCVTFDSSNALINHCDVNNDGVYNEACALGSRCLPTNNPNGGCGDTGVCAGGKTVTLDTTQLSTQIQISIGNYDERYFAVCYEDAGAWYDAGIRVTLPEVIDVFADSGYYTHTQDAQPTWGNNDVGGTPVRHQRSWDQLSGTVLVERATNRLPQQANMQLTYVEHTTAQFGTGKYLSVVDASLNSNDPCVIGTDAAGAASTQHSGAIKASKLKVGVIDSSPLDTKVEGRTVTIPQSNSDTNLQLSATKIFAVCYSKGTGNPNDLLWRDSYIRLKISKVAALITVGVTHLTSGQVPNVFAADGLKFQYVGSLASGKYLSLVDATLNSGLPCIPAEAGSAPATNNDASHAAWTKKATHSGAKQADTGQKYVTTFNTHHLSTDKEFALCYTDGTGSASDPNWADSGVRLTTPKVYAVQIASENTGPATKADTRPRTMNSIPYATNVMPAVEDQVLTYVGDLAQGKHISLVQWSEDMAGNREYKQFTGRNPCVYPWLAAAAASAIPPVTLERNGERVFSGSSTAASGTKDVTIGQKPILSLGLDPSSTFAVCYATGDGTMSDTSWRDSYIRLKISRVEKVLVKIPLVTVGTTTNAIETQTITIKTVGQIPNQALSNQVIYTYAGTLEAGKYISLVDSELNSQTEVYTGIAVFDPCSDPNSANPIVNTNDPNNNDARHKDNVHSRSRVATLGTKDVGTLDTTLLKDDKLYSFCYSTDGSSFKDSGLRITLPQIHTLHYQGAPVSITARDRGMTSIHLATNKLPQVQSIQLTYEGGITGVGGGLAAGKYVSLVTTASNSGNPCVNPTVAAASADTTHSGPVTAVGNVVTVPQTVLLSETQVYAACYASGDGSVTDDTWRDSYIRVTVTKVQSVTSFGVTHKTTGQIANHANLVVQYSGSLLNGKYLTLVDAGNGQVTLGSKQYPMPCTVATEAFHSEDTAHAQSSIGTDPKSVVVNTVSLQVGPDRQPSPGSSPFAPRYYAICYTDSPGGGAGVPYVDTGIRVTLPDFIDFEVASGYTGSTERHQTSEMLATNVISQASAQVLTYLIHSTSEGCKSSNLQADANCARGNAKYISLVDASLDGGDPCAVPATAGASQTALHTGPVQASATDKKVSIDASGLNAAKTFAVCYSLGADLWNAAAANGNDGGVSDDYWRDSYVRLKVSKIDKLTTLGVSHKTYGQVPNTVPADQLDFTYSGSLGATAFLSLVDASLNSMTPCVGNQAGVAVGDSQHSTAKQASGGKVSSFDTTGLTTSPGLSNMRVDGSVTTGQWFAVCYAESGGTDSDIWYDSGIRVTVPKVYNVKSPSGYLLSRAHTSAPLATNRVAKASGQQLTYTGDLATDKYISLVDSTKNNNNPCVNAAEAAHAAADMYSGPLQAASGIKQVTFDASALLLISGPNDVQYAVCYDENAGTTGSLTWADSYIRLKLTEVTYFTTKGVTHRTDGQIPRHKASLVYTYEGSLAAGKYLSLVDAALGPQAVNGFSAQYPNPCEDGNIAAASATSQHTGPLLDSTGQKQINTLNTMNLLSSKTFALCFATGAGNTADTSWRDSGIRLTVPLLTEIKFSGMLEHLATASGKESRTLTSVLAPLQGSDVVANVLPQMSNLPFIYGGDLGVSKFTSLVDVSLNNNNPCVDAAIAAASADTQRSGPVRSCLSYEGLCLPNGVGASTAGNKEIVIPGSTVLDASKTFTVCYTTGDGSTGDAEWRDSYIRLKISQVQSITATGVTHMDHGHVASHEDASKLSITYAGQLANTLPAATWMSLVDETLNSNDPCIGADGSVPAKSVAATADSGTGQYSGPFRGSAYSVAVMTSHLSTSLTFAVCYSADQTSVLATAQLATTDWKDSGIRVTVTKLHTLRYNDAQLPTTRLISGQAASGLPKFTRLITSSRVKTGQPVCQVIGGSSIATNKCDGPVPDGTFDNQCNQGYLCNPDEANNGGCGTLGLCTAGLGPDSTYATTYNQATMVKLPQVSKSICTAVSITGLGGDCDSDFDGVFHDTCVVGSLCEATNPNNGGCGATGTCTVYDIDFEYVGDLATGKHVSLVDASANNNDPCALPSLAAATASSTTSGVITAVAKGVSLSYGILTPLNPALTFTVCYAEGDGSNSDATWRDSYIRFTVSKIEAIQSHQIVHTTQGHIANSDKLDVTYRGSLGPAGWLSLVDEVANSNAPCADSAEAAHVAGATWSGPVQAAAGSKRVQFDTSNMQTSKNYAACYSEGGTTGDSWYDSGIRVTISAVTKLSYNELQQGFVAGGEYTRDMFSTNAAPASDTFPVATNILPSIQNARYTYSGGAVTQYVSLVAVSTSLNSNNPCADEQLASGGASSARSGPIEANSGTRTVIIPQASAFLGAGGEATFAMCHSSGVYTDTRGGAMDNMWRDTFIRLKVTAISSIKSYDIQHITHGYVANKPALSIVTLGQLAATAKLALVDETVNSYQPCTGAEAAKSPAVNPSGASQGSEQQYSGVSTHNTGNKHTLPTDKLSTANVYAVCYTEGAGSLADTGWTDSGIRLQTPKMTSLSFGSPARLLTAESCFGDDPSITLANCQAGASAAHYNSQLPRAENVQVTYGGPKYGDGLPAGSWISLVEQTQDKGSTGEANNPCRDANSATQLPATDGSPQNERLHTGVLQAATGTKNVIMPSTQDIGQGTYNYLDVTKTFAVCYSETDPASDNYGWRDSYVRVTLQKIHTLQASGVIVNTIGTLGSVSSLEVRWTGSLGTNQWLRFTSVDSNSNAPCDKSNANVAAGVASTVAIQSGASSAMVTVDSAVLLASSANGQYYAVCYAEGAGDNSDTTWKDSGIRLRFIRWTNAAKSRIPSGAPVRLSFSINMGSFHADNDKVVLLNGVGDCSTAVSAPLYSDGSKLARNFDHTCTVLGGTNVGLCDRDFDGSYSETCTLGALCQPGTGTEGGCGTGGSCEGTIQLPSGASYDALHDENIHTESKLSEGFYVLCMCLGVNGDGGCQNGNDFTRVYSPTVPGQTIKVISEPRLGRYRELSGQQDVRHISGMSHQFSIKASSRTAGFQVQDNDKIYFVPSGIGCGQLTKYSGAGSHVYDHATNSYISTGVDRRWRTIAQSVCTSVDAGTATSYCDANYDGIYLDTCTVDAFCDPSNANNGGCGATGVCGSPIPQTDAVDRTSMLSVQSYSSSTLVGIITTPNVQKLATVQNMVACFATAESLQGALTDVTDFVALQDNLEVISSPRLGPISSPGHIHALEMSTPTFTVNTMKYGDLIYFVPKSQSNPDPVATDSDCVPNVCTVIGASNVGNNCDASYDGSFTDTCVFRARCNPGNNYNGGCGAGGTCTQQVPTVTTSYYTGLLNGTSFVDSNGVTTGQVLLPPLFVSRPAVTSASYLAACFIPAGAIQSLPTNVKPLEDMLTILVEPTDSLVTSWFQYHVLELRFTQPQVGFYGNPSFATGQPGDIIVLKTGSCTGVHEVSAAGYSFGNSYSSRFMLEEAGGTTVGDEKGGMASVVPLAVGKVNELSPGTYKVCYATKSSEGESQSDFKELVRTLEILPPPATTPQLTVPRTVMLGQDIVIHWQSNIGLQDRLSAPNTWIGLFSAGHCSSSTEWRHECYKSFQFIEKGVESGTVRFSQSDYKVAGEYDVRYFIGDSRNGQGEICKGLTGVEHETYVQCLLDPAVTSSSIHIHGPDIKDMEDLESQPGMEVVFSGNRGRFN